MTASPSIAELLGPDGPVARRLSGFELRPQQLEMADAVREALAHRRTLLVEAGTGVGKSFAYLLPAIRHSLESGRRIVIATHTISLQEQLIERDIPLLRAALPDEFTAVLVKGRSNYLSIRRLKLASERQQTLFPDREMLAQLHAVEDWAYETTDGSLASLPQIPPAEVWDRVQSDADNCMGRRCPSYEQCFFQAARRRMAGANLLICNHALYFADLAMRSWSAENAIDPEAPEAASPTRSMGGILPDYDHVILDEAHHLEDVASRHFGLSVSEGRVHHLLNVLYRQRVARGTMRVSGFLARLDVGPDDTSLVDDAVRSVLRVRDAVEALYEDLYHTLPRGGDSGRSQRLRGPDTVDNPATPALAELASRLSLLKEAVVREDDRYELNAYAARARSLSKEIEAILGQHLDEFVYWIETRAQQRGRPRLTVSASPVDVAKVLRERLFNGERSVILTSATLTTSRGDFSHLQKRLGCDDPETVRTLALGSPFDYPRQVEFYVEAGLPDPGQPSYVAKVIPRLLHHIDATGGGAFVLFTSFSMLNQMARELEPALAQRGLPLLVHGRDGPRGLILNRFRDHENAVLLGTSSFWEGVDVRGQALRSVIIARLPFEVPDHPLVEARVEHIRRRGGDPFREDQLPRAIIRFRQGFGRLIRSATDHGRFVVLDSRIVTKGYGAMFRRALPGDLEIRTEHDD